MPVSDELDPQLDQQIRLTIMRVMALLYQQGIHQVHMGGLMRVLGVSNQQAAEHDDEVVILDENFANYVTQITAPRPPDQSLH